MASYIIRKIDTELWTQAKAKAALQGTTVKAVIEGLLRQWIAS